MYLWRAIIDFFKSGQRRRAIPAASAAVEVVNSHQREPLIPAAITLTKHETGITLEFPMREDRRPILRALAWRQFHGGLFFLMVPILAYASCQFFGYRHSINYWTPVFVTGLFLLAAAANKSSVINQDAYDDDLQQLSVLGNLLVRTSRDLHKQVWYQHEIRDIALMQGARPKTANIASGDVGNLRLEVSLSNGDVVSLIPWNSDLSLVNSYPREELEWVATQLRLALFPTAPQSSDDPHATAIRAKDASREETRYTE